MASRLSLYNDALLLCGHRELTSLSEEVEGRRLLDQVWNNGGVDTCLQNGHWYFARRSIQLDPDPAEDPAFGYNFAFTVPDDLVKTTAVCADEYFRVPITEYTREGGLWYADINPMYVKYVSNGASYGGNIGDWPETFKEYVAAYFAKKIVLNLTGDPDKASIVVEEYKVCKASAEAKDAMEQPPTFPPVGRWVRSRGNNTRREGGNLNGPLIG